MNLNQVTANIRLRSAWEAVDLGFVMVQQWWKAIYLPLIIVTFSIAVPIFYLLPFEQYWLSLLIFWWLKPLYDRLVLHIISHKLFNEELSSLQALKAIPSLIWNTGFFQTMTFRRFSFSRGFNLPIWQLEKLRGRARSQRQDVLHMIAHSTAVWLTIGLRLVEVILMFSLFALVLVFMPEDMSGEILENLFTNNLQYESWIAIVLFVFYVLVVTLLHPFYVAGSFALYINRRTQLEAWDIELDFRKMNQRFEELDDNLGNVNKNKSIASSAFLFIIAFIFFNAASTSPVLAEEDVPEILSSERQTVDQSKQMIDEVMLTKNLNDKRKVKKWVAKKTDKKKKKKKSKMDLSWMESLSEIIATVFEAVLWIALAIGIFLLYFYRERWLHLFNTKKNTDDEYVAPEVMFGMDVRPESLPDDVIAESRSLWQKGKHRQSLSLLYRGALIRLINQERIKLQDSHTEGDIIKQAARTLTQNDHGKSKQTYLQLLTRQWQSIAYAHRVPEDEIMQTLFNTWESDFAISPVNSVIHNDAIQGHGE
ncbi:MAG: hypothetical protein V3U71_00725 [Cocleimonas sp.]